MRPAEIAVVASLPLAVLTRPRAQRWRVTRRAGADLEHCCRCGEVTDQAYYAERLPAPCAAPLPDGARFSRWQRLVRWWRFA